MPSNKSKYNSKYKQGKYNCINPHKYIGNPSDIVFRSSWEYSFCVYLDKNEKILRWSCEQPVITYQDLRNKVHRYYPDFFYEIMVGDDPNNFKRVIVEIKPGSELYPPKKPEKETGKKLESYEYAVRTHIKNKLKWEAAVNYAKKHKMEFIIITEDILRKKGLIK